MEPAHHHLRRPCVEGALHERGHPVDVEERQVDEDDVVAPYDVVLALAVDDLPDVAVEVRVGPA